MKRPVSTAALNRLVLPIGIIATLVTVVSLIGAAFAEEASEERVQMTDHYRITLEMMTPPPHLLMPDEAADAKEGHVVINTQSIPMERRDLVPMIDLGEAVNCHLEVYVYDRATGALLNDVMPRFSIIGQGTGTARELASPMKMYDIKDGPSNFHFGTNAYLHEGLYTVSVTVAGETANFEDITMKWSSPPSETEEASGNPESGNPEN